MASTATPRASPSCSRRTRSILISGTGRIVAAGKVEVKAADGKVETLETKNIVIATGSDVAKLKGIEIDEKRIISSTGALMLDKVPEKMLVIGAGVIGLELGSVWRRLGTEVVVVEFLDRILPGHGRRSRKILPAHPRKAGHGLQARRQGHRASTLPEKC